MIWLVVYGIGFFFTFGALKEPLDTAIFGALFWPATWLIALGQAFADRGRQR